MKTLCALDDVDQPRLQFEVSNCKRLLVPVDFSVCSLETLRYAKRFADRFGAIVHVLHVVQPGFYRDTAAKRCRDLIQASTEAARQELRKLVGLLWADETGAAVTVREGCTHEIILCEARATNTELIIMGAGKARWLRGMLQRNTVKQVIQKSSCPVMVFRTGMISVSGPNLEGASSPAPNNNFH